MLTDEPSVAATPLNDPAMFDLPIGDWVDAHAARAIFGGMTRGALYNLLKETNVAYRDAKPLTSRGRQNTVRFFDYDHVRALAGERGYL